MCRLLWARAREPFDIPGLLERFAEVARNSPEYQGHGWGCAWLEAGRWEIYRNIQPMWDDDFDRFSRTTLLLAHARSAFRNEGIQVENNMPFFDGERVFVFNGELHGVRIREKGRIGAEKVFNYLKRFDTSDALDGVRRAVEIIEKRTRRLRAMNLIMADCSSSRLVTMYSENPEYFQMHRGQVNGIDLVCSQPIPGTGNWQAIANRTLVSL